MTHLTSSETMRMLIALGLLIGVARALGEVAKRFNQPTVLGEILAGILLGPSVLGYFVPQATAFLFPPVGPNAVALNAISTVAVVLFLLVAGMEVDFSLMLRQGKAAAAAGVSGIVAPFAIGFAVAWFFPSALGGIDARDKTVFALFFATALSISALPVIAKTLMDLGLYRSDFGVIVVAAAILNDVAGWLIFAFIVGMLGSSLHPGMDISLTVLFALGYLVAIVTVGRWLVNRVLPWIQAHTTWPGGILSAAVVVALFSAAFTEWLGIHAVFGAFLVGLAIGDSPHLRQHTRSIIGEFVSFVFAPVFFASIGIRINFFEHFSLTITSIVLVVACAGKILGCGFGARLGGMSKQEAWALGFALNSRGAMEIILGLLALQFGIIEERLFVSLVIMALITSMMGGPMIQFILKPRRARRFTEFLSGKSFVASLRSATRKEAIYELSQTVALGPGLDAIAIAEAVWRREEIMPTGMGNAIAIPHARVKNVTNPLVAVGISCNGIDFDAPDGQPAQIIVLLITSDQESGVQLDLLADVTRCFRNAATVQLAANAANYTEFLAVMRAETGWQVGESRVEPVKGAKRLNGSNGASEA